MQCFFFVVSLHALFSFRSKAVLPKVVGCLLFEKWNPNEIQMCMGFLFLSATCDWMIVLQSLKFENFTTFFFLFALLISGWFGEFVLFLLNYLEFICMVVVYHVHVVVRQQLFDFFSFDFILLMHCCLSLTCGCKTRTFWFLFFWFYTTDA